MMRGRFVIDSPQAPLNLGIGRRSPIMANGQVPGIRRQYNTEYAEALRACYDETYGRLDRGLRNLFANSFGGIDTTELQPVDRMALHHMSERWEPIR